MNKLLLKFLLIVKIGTIISTDVALASELPTILEKNELHTIQLIDFTHFSNQNPDIIKIKKQEEGNKIILKGQKPGSSHLYFWGKREKHKKRSFVVTTSKIKKALKLSKTLNLNFHHNEEGFSLSGTIDKKVQYKQLATIHQLAPELNLESINIENKLKKWILSELYQSLWKDQLYSISCDMESPHIHCEVWDPPKFALEKIQKRVKRSFIVRWIKRRDSTPRCLNLFLYEGSKSQEGQFSVSKETLPISFRNTIAGQSILDPTYSSSAYNFELINKMSLQFIPGGEYFIKIGETKGKITATGFLKKDIDEKFFDGLKIKFKIIKNSYFYIMDSKNSFISSNSSERKVFKNQSVSSTKIVPNQETYLISYRYHRKSDSSFNIFNLIKRAFFSDFRPTNSSDIKFLKATIKIQKECSNG